MDLSGKRTLVVGLGKTGTATAQFLFRQGADVVVTDEKAPSELRDAFALLDNLGVRYRFHCGGPDMLSGIAMVVPSPGVAPANRTLTAALRQAIPVVSELELASHFLKRPMIAITGTNGKTTTTTLMGEILAQSGRPAFVGGNIGTPLISYVGGDQPDDYAVIEVSSFQLQWIRDFRPEVAILLNVTCDHVDYHGSFEAYYHAKARIFKNQTPGNLAILNADEAYVPELVQKISSTVRYFSSSRSVASGIYLKGDQMVCRLGEGEAETYPVDMVKVPGIHNLENVMAAVVAARWAGCLRETIIRTVSGFRGIAHRIEYAGEKDGIAFYDDSKATNAGAVIRALEAFSKPVVLLMGGRDKDGDFDILSPVIEGKVKRLILFGEARQRIREMIGGVVKTDLVDTFREAMPLARRHAEAGDVVLLAPGCASFDEFKNYKERGDVFKKWVGSLS